MANIESLVAKEFMSQDDIYNLIKTNPVPKNSSKELHDYNSAAYNMLAYFCHGDMSRVLKKGLLNKTPGELYELVWHFTGHQSYDEKDIENLNKAIDKNYPGYFYESYLDFRKESNDFERLFDVSVENPMGMLELMAEMNLPKELFDYYTYLKQTIKFIDEHFYTKSKPLSKEDDELFLAGMKNKAELGFYTEFMNPSLIWWQHPIKSELMKFGAEHKAKNGYYSQITRFMYPAKNKQESAELYKKALIDYSEDSIFLAIANWYGCHDNLLSHALNAKAPLEFYSHCKRLPFDAKNLDIIIEKSKQYNKEDRESFYKLVEDCGYGVIPFIVNGTELAEFLIKYNMQKKQKV